MTIRSTHIYVFTCKHIHNVCNSCLIGWCGIFCECDTIIILISILHQSVHTHKELNLTGNCLDWIVGAIVSICAILTILNSNRFKCSTFFLFKFCATLIHLNQICSMCCKCQSGCHTRTHIHFFNKQHFYESFVSRTQTFFFHHEKGDKSFCSSLEIRYGFSYISYHPCYFRFELQLHRTIISYNQI